MRPVRLVSFKCSSGYTHNACVKLRAPTYFYNPARRLFFAVRVCIMTETVGFIRDLTRFVRKFNPELRYEKLRSYVLGVTHFT